MSQPTSSFSNMLFNGHHLVHEPTKGSEEKADEKSKYLK
jgi:hypothetical protein